MGCCRSLSSYCGPLIVIGIGIGFIVVGSLPVIATSVMGIKTSATIIGVGFMGFGLLLLLPGLIWCIYRRTVTLPCCARERLRSDSQEKSPSLREFSPGCLLKIDECQISEKVVTYDVGDMERDVEDTDVNDVDASVRLTR